jgi:hypothetical protein
LDESVVFESGLGSTFLGGLFVCPNDKGNVFDDGCKGGFVGVNVNEEKAEFKSPNAPVLPVCALVCKPIVFEESGLVDTEVFDVVAFDVVAGFGAYNLRMLFFKSLRDVGAVDVVVACNVCADSVRTGDVNSSPIKEELVTLSFRVRGFGEDESVLMTGVS